MKRYCDSLQARTSGVGLVLKGIEHSAFQDCASLATAGFHCVSLRL